MMGTGQGVGHLAVGLGGTPRGSETHTCCHRVCPGPPFNQCCREKRQPVLELGLLCAWHTRVISYSWSNVSLTTTPRVIFLEEK